jgi:TonB-linked SusC/RagA family outer membrane protein
MKKLLLFFTMFSVFIPFAQGQHTVTGVVSDETGPLPGANVVIQGTTTGTVTDLDGKYTIIAHSRDTLVFSYMGYEDQKIKVGKKGVINVVLTTEKQLLDEVVVVGYGTMKKSDLTGATSAVKVSEEVARQTSTVDQMLQGRAAGVQVTSNNGNPGDGVSVQIRGINTLTGNNQPLYVVDGIIVTTAGQDVVDASSDGNDYQQPQNGLAGINPADIESIEILKDASATAIYGSRGANGVVLITTKSGNSGEMTADAFFITGVSVISKKLNVLNGTDYAMYRNETNILKGQDPQFYIDEDGNVFGMSIVDGEPVIGEYMKQENWQDYIYKPGWSFNTGVSFSGGTKKGNYYVAASFNDINGIVDNSKVQSGNLRLNLTQDIGKKFTLDSRVSLFYDKNNFAQSGSKAGSNQSFVKSTLTFSPLVGDTVFDFQNDLGISNPLSWINDFEDVSNNFRSQISLNLTYKLPVKGLKFQIRGAGDIWLKERRRWYGITTFPGEKTNGRLSISGLSKFSYNIDNLIHYNRTFNNVHSINATVGYVFQGINREDSKYEVIDFTTYGFTVDGPEYGTVTTVPLTIYPQQELMNSFLTRINYSFKHKYSITATFRADGSSKFAKGNRYSYFPSFSAAWRISEEGFMKSAQAVSSLKLRFGWGLTGNQGINPYQTFSNYNVAYYSLFDNTTINGFVPMNIANPELKWETTSQFNLGIDFGFFKDRLSGTIDGYYKNTYDLLQNIEIPRSTGFKTMMVNRGTIMNKGIDIMLSGIAVSKKDIYLSIGGNLSINRNEIKELGISDAPFYIDGTPIQASFYYGKNVSTGSTFKAPANVFMVGQPAGLFYGLRTDGIIQEGDKDIPEGFQPGDLRVLDLDGDGLITPNDRTILGDPNPDFTYGVHVDFNYKRLSFNLQGYGVYGNDIMNGFNIEFYTAEGNNKNINPVAYHEAWRPDKPSNTYPRILFSEEGWFAPTDRIIEDGSYFRLTDITIGYDLPIKGIENFNIYMSLKNILTITGYTGYDPNVISYMYDGSIIGVDWNQFPNTRTFIFGLNMSF